ncbi:MAG: AAA family ATPase, partial [Solirubrobacteraceae bacterium]
MRRALYLDGGGTLRKVGTDSGERVSAGARLSERLLERQDELERLRSAIVAATAGAGSLVLLEGPAGIGKTALLATARELAGEQGLRVLIGRGRDLEQEFAFGVARQLFEPVLLSLDPARRARVLDGAAALAAPLFQRVRAGRELPPPPTPAAGRGEASFRLVHG